MNILILKNYTITDHTKWYNDRTRETDLVNNYNEMEKVCVASAQAHIKDLDEIIVHRGEADNIRDVFRKHFVEIYDVWKQGHNVLYCDLDVVFTKPVEYFGKFDHFCMFNYTEPKQTHDDHYDLSFHNFFNCGVRYYPQSMDHDIWDVGFEMLDNWNPNRWDSEQIIYNAMMWKQDIEPDEQIRPEYAYQLLHSPIEHPVNKSFNRIGIEQARCVHVHSSRGSANRLSLMKQLFVL